jgi:hypothetical protein
VAIWASSSTVHQVMSLSDVGSSIVAIEQDSRALQAAGSGSASACRCPDLLVARTPLTGTLSLGADPTLTGTT